MESQNVGYNSNTQHNLFLASNTCSENENIWYLDTGGSNHMCGKSTVRFGKNANIPMMGKCQNYYQVEGWFSKVYV